MGILDPIVMFKGPGSFMKKVQLFIYEMWYDSGLLLLWRNSVNLWTCL